MIVHRLLPGLDSAADHLARECLRTIARHSTGTELRDLIDDVLGGRRPLRDALAAPEMAHHVALGFERVQDEWVRLSPRERAEIAGQTRRR